MLTKTVCATLAALGVLLCAAPAPRAEEAATKDVVQTAVAAGNFKTLVAAVKAAGLAEALEGKGPFTVFAPTDEAFAKLGEEKVAALLKDKAKLKDVLLYHVVKGNVLAKDAVALDGKSAKALDGKSIMIAVKNDSVVLNGNAKVIKPDIKCSNGVIHVIDAVLLPPSE